MRSVTRDPRRRPEVVGIVVEMLSAKAVKTGEGIEEVGKLVERLLGLWRWAELGFAKRDWRDANKKLLMWAPVWHGMLLAQKILGEESQLGRELGEKIGKDLEPLLNKAREVVAANTPEKGGTRGLTMYEQLTLAGIS